MEFNQIKTRGLVVSKMVPQIGNQILLEAKVSGYITHLMLHNQEIYQVSWWSGLGRNILTLRFPALVNELSSRSSSTMMLCMITQAVMIYQRIFRSQNLDGPRTIANCDCKIPKALSTSFLAAACAL